MNTDLINQNETSQSLINQRIESVEDPQLNRALFTLYERLVQPFREVEGLQAEIENKKSNIEKNKLEIKGFLSRFWFALKILAILFIVLKFVVFLVACYPLKDTVLFTIAEKYYCITDEIFGYHSDLWFFILIPLILAVITSLVPNLLINKKLKNLNAKLQEEIVVLECQLSEKVDALRDVACFVPMDYRNSYALEFFVNAFANSKIDNLKEAVNLSDTQAYRNSMLQSQKQMCNMLSQIAFNQLTISSQLDSLKRSVWFSEAIF